MKKGTNSHHWCICKFVCVLCTHIVCRYGVCVLCTHTYYMWVWYVFYVHIHIICGYGVCVLCTHTYCMWVWCVCFMYTYILYVGMVCVLCYVSYCHTNTNWTLLWNYRQCRDHQNYFRTSNVMWSEIKRWCIKSLCIVLWHMKVSSNLLQIMWLEFVTVCVCVCGGFCKGICDITI